MRSFAALVAVCLLAATARADEVSFPLVVDYPLLQAAFEHDLHPDADGTAVLWGHRGGCRYLTLRDVRLASDADRVRLTARTAARVGVGFLGFCIGPVSWDGYLETLATPELTPG
jgi:hypothetical protein